MAWREIPCSLRLYTRSVVLADAVAGGIGAVEAVMVVSALHVLMAAFYTAKCARGGRSQSMDAPVAVEITIPGQHNLLPSGSVFSS